jgi:spermidine synthase
LKGIVQTFLQSFPDARALLLHFNVDVPVLGLVGREGAGWESATLAERLKTPALKEPLRKVGVERSIQLLGSLAGDSISLAHYAGRAPLGTDDRPNVLFFAPYHTVQRQARPSDVLLDFLQTVAVDRPRLAATVAGPSQEPLRQAQGGPSSAQLQAFMEARDLYLAGLVKEGGGELSAAIELYLASAQRSLYFTPAYARCVTIIQLMARADRQRARELYRRLEAAQPEQPLAKKLLGPLLDEGPPP